MLAGLARGGPYLVFRGAIGGGAGLHGGCEMELLMRVGSCWLCFGLYLLLGASGPSLPLSVSPLSWHFF